MTEIEVKEIFVKQLEDARNYDIEAAHKNADAILCALLRVLGYAEVVEAYEKVEKWYA